MTRTRSNKNNVKKKVKTEPDTEPNKSSRKIPLIIGSLVVVFALIAAFVVINATTKKISQGEISELEKVMSADAGQVFITPASSDWWAFIADASYDSKNLATMDPIAENEGILKLGYARSVNTDEATKNGGALRITYLQADTQENAQGLAEWFEAQRIETSEYNVRIKDNIVAIGPDWAFEDRIYFDDTPLGNDENYLTKTAKAYRNANVGFAYMNTGKYFESLLATKMDGSATTALNEYLRYAFGMKDKENLWVGNAGAYNALWKGNFVQGGVDETLLDPAKANDILQGRQQVVDDTGEEVVIDPRESAIISEVFVSTKNSTETEKINFNTFFEPYNDVFSKEGFSENDATMRGAINLPQWNSSLSDIGQRPENLSTALFAVKGSEMTFTFLRTE